MVAQAYNTRRLRSEGWLLKADATLGYMMRGSGERKEGRKHH